ncbi:MAG: histidinol-phosphate transaminase [Clostridia bacterium]|nr:histidinol-phosphate transaminase [Clostridia bacterium]
MNKYISPRMAAMKEYVPNTDVYKIRLDANESPFLPDAETKRKISEAVAAVSFNRYPDPLATEAVKKYAAYIDVSPELITPGNGSDELINVIIQGFFSHGDRLYITPPDFSMYEFYAQLKELEIVSFDRAERMYKIPCDALIADINEKKPRAVMFSNPCNPLGQAYSRDEILKLVKSVSALCIIDEAYMDFYGDSVVRDTRSFDNLIVLRTASKAAGFAAARLGFAVTNAELTSVIRKVKSPFNVNSLTQAAACVVLSDPEKLKSTTETIVNERKYLESKLAGLCAAGGFELIPTVSNFALMRGENAVKVFTALKKESIAIRCLSSEYLRVTAGTREENDEFLAAFIKVLKEI